MYHFNVIDGLMERVRRVIGAADGRFQGQCIIGGIY